MRTLTQPLRDEHRELAPSIELLRTVADSVGFASLDSVRSGIDAASAFLGHHLIPHAEAEEQALYPSVQDALGARQATATMSRDHVEIGRLTQELEELQARCGGDLLDGGTAAALRRVLYGLYALVKLHLAKEEEVYLPILEAWLTPDSAQRMFVSMEAAAARAKEHRLVKAEPVALAQR